MAKAGGILGIIAGIFGILAALATIFLGGVGGALKADGAETVVGLGFGGVVFSIIVIITGAIAMDKPKGGGISMIVSSIAGMILGGTIVGACLSLSLLGGILAMFGKKKVKEVTTS